MNWKLLTGLVFTGLVLSGCGQVNKPGNVGGGSVGKSLRDLIVGGQAQKCTIKTTEEGGSIESEMWIKGKKFKQTTKSKSPGEGGEMTTNVISDGEWVYSWNDKSNSGMKVKMEESEKEPQKEEEETESKFFEGTVDWDKQMNYECQPVNMADSEFVPPAEIKFADWQTEAEKLKQKMEEQLKGLTLPTGIISGDGEEE